MKTLILYASKYGAAQDVARRIANKINATDIYDLKQPGIPSAAAYDCVIIGSSVYAGSVRKELKTYLPQNADILQGKILGLFLCGLNANLEKEYFTTNFTPELLQTAKATAFLGGIFDPKKTGVFERLIMKAVTKQSEYVDVIDDKKIEQFVQTLKA